MHNWITICFLLLYSLCYTQTEYHFVVKFNRKSTSHSIYSPEEFLSEKTIQRRQDYNKEIDSLDLPLENSFIDSLKTLNVLIESKSRWNNSVVFSTKDPSLKETIKGWGFIHSIESIGYKTTNKTSTNKFDYGLTEYQNNLLNIIYAHNSGFTGNNIEISIIDAGYTNMNTISIFDSLFNSKRLLSSYNFVTNGPVNFKTHSHGTMVSSPLLGNKPGSYIGAAPNANYHLLISEDLSQENMIEEYHLIEAIEYSDSAGADIINISLGYFSFDSPQYSHSKNEFTGDSTVLNQICNRAWAMGNFIVSSAGNEGASNWGVLTSPSNADSVFCIGGIDLALEAANFTSRGNPTVNNNQKPNVVAIGKDAYVVQIDGQVVKSNGTSFASPQITGFVACLMEAFPDLKNWQIRKAIEISSHQYNNPDSIIGYGYPNFEKAFLYLNSKKSENDEEEVILYPNPSDGFIALSSKEKIMSIMIDDMNGKKVYQKEINSEFDIINLNHLNIGEYFIKVYLNDNINTLKLILK